MAEIWFYHLESQPFARALPALVEKAVERGWRVAVQTIDDLRLKAIDDLLWTYREDGFLAHGLARDPQAERQPIVLATDGANPNKAALRMYVEGAEIGVAGREDYERIILLFDGREDEEVAAARRQWSRLKAEGAALVYWQQTASGGWERKHDTSKGASR